MSSSSGEMLDCDGMEGVVVASACSPATSWMGLKPAMRVMREACWGERGMSRL